MTALLVVLVGVPCAAVWWAMALRPLLYRARAALRDWRRRRCVHAWDVGEEFGGIDGLWQAWAACERCGSLELRTRSAPGTFAVGRSRGGS